MMVCGCDGLYMDQVMVIRDWAMTLARRSDPGLVLIFGEVDIMAASIAFRLALVNPWCKIVASTHRGR